ncbi:hypothetical protein ACQ4LE_001533 [Meloidogyne hapla]|uniref:Alpha-1,3-glucosyltransferase n=1 Tax=Meloidogyne hapla TaxID=6305 RepID=A0A1I8BCM7_MELHA
MRMTNSQANGCFSMLRDPRTWLLFGFIASIKFMLFNSYRSTDFEVHRNWMSIVYNLPLGHWYHSKLSQWTLDYPPFFAYFEWLLAKIASFVDPKILTLGKEEYFSKSTLYFQRASVVMADFVYFLGCASISSSFVSKEWAVGEKFIGRAKLSLFALLMLNPALILLDNIHFQYNGFLYGFLLLSIGSIARGDFLKGALFYAILLNFKHLYLYYAPAFIIFYLSWYYYWEESKGRVFSLMAILIGIFSLSFGPFLIEGIIAFNFKDGIRSSIGQILSRLFPFKRGLTHANWAPNFWAIYNFVDAILAKSIFYFSDNCSSTVALLLKKCPPTSEFTKGIVGEYSHSILPDVSPLLTLLIIVIILIATFWRFKDIEEYSHTDFLLISLLLSAYPFFLFGWHVHEKAILMLFFPLAILSIKDSRFIEPFSLIFIVSTFAQFPLLFTPIENYLIKISFIFGIFAIGIVISNYLWQINPSELIRCPVAKNLIKGILLGEFYALIGHKLVFSSNQYNFLPIMVTSVICSLTMIYSYLSILLAVFGINFGINIQKRKLHRKEEKILSLPETTQFDERSIRYIAGIDLSTSTNHPSFGVVGLTVLAYPSMKVVYCADETVLLSSLGGVMPYLPEYFAIKEAKPLIRVLRRHLKNCPKIDLIFIDANGKWHSRGCGLACHIGYELNIPTIGVAKKLNEAPLLLSGYCERDDLADIDREIDRKCEQSEGLATMFHINWNKSDKIKLPNVAVIRTNSSKKAFFVSVGFGIDFVSASKIAFNCIGKNSYNVNPIRLSDLRSKRRIEEIFDY